MKTKSGFSLLETMLAVGVLALISMASIGLYRNYSKSIELETGVSSIISDLKNAQSKSINGEQDLKWGVHFVNVASDPKDYYEIFSTATDYAGGTVNTKVYLAGGTTFSDPTDNTSKDIIYGKIKGTISGDTIVKIISDGTEKTITVTALGNIY